MAVDGDTGGAALRQRGGAETRERILRCMMQMIEAGLGDDVQLRDVAREAGVSAALIIRYFGSKSDLTFEALTTRLVEVDNAELLARDAVGGFKAVEDLIRYVLSSDMQSRHRIGAVMEMAWRRSADHEARFAAALAPRDAILRRLLKAECLKASDTAVQRAATLLRIAYFEALRLAFVHGWTVEETLASLAPTRKTIVAALAAGLADA